MKVLIVDDHPLIREALRYVLKALDQGIELLEAQNCSEALELTGGHPDNALILQQFRPRQTALEWSCVLHRLIAASGSMSCSAALDRMLR